MTTPAPELAPAVEAAGSIIRTPRNRRIVAWVMGGAGLLLTSVGVYLSAVGIVRPDWLIGALAVYTFVSSTTHGIWAANIPTR